MPAKSVASKPEADFLSGLNVPRTAKPAEQLDHIVRNDRPAKDSDKIEPHDQADAPEIAENLDNSFKTTDDAQPHEEGDHAECDQSASDESTLKPAIPSLVNTDLLAGLIQTVQAIETPAAAISVADTGKPFAAVITTLPQKTVAQNAPQNNSPIDGNDAAAANAMIEGIVADTGATNADNDLPLNVLANTASSAAISAPASNAAIKELADIAKSMATKNMSVESEADAPTPPPAAASALPQTPAAAGAPTDNNPNQQSPNDDNADLSASAKPDKSDNAKSSANPAAASFASKLDQPAAKDPAAIAPQPMITPQVLAAQNNAAITANKAAPAQISAGHVAVEQVKFQIVKSVKDGVDRIKIHLSPEDLGRVDIRLDMHKDGSIKAVIAADKPETAQWLERDAKHLERALQDAGLKTDSNSLQFESRGNQSQSQNPFLAMYNNGSQHGKNYGSVKHAAVHVATDHASGQIQPIYSANSGVNILV